MSNLDEQPFPRAPLIAAILVVGLTVAGVGATRLGLISPGVAEASNATPVTAADMRFSDMDDGGVLVTVIDDGERIIPPATGGFVRGVLRGLVRDRRAQGLGSEQPFRVTEWSDGKVTIQDLATGRIVKLDAFGPTNRQAFLDLMTPPSETAA
jgi:putative photosynthetic complex assembly protein